MSTIDVLVVSEQKDLSQRLTDAFGACARITSVSAGLDALQKARSHRTDLIIAEEAVGDLDGCGLLLNLRQHETTWSIPVILLTGGMSRFGDGLGARNRLAFYGEEAQAYIPKPVDIEELVVTVYEVFRDSAIATFSK